MFDSVNLIELHVIKKPALWSLLLGHSVCITCQVTNYT